MYVCMWDELVTWGSDFVLILFGGWIWNNTPWECFIHPFAHAFLFCGGCCFTNNLCYAIMEYYTIITPPICTCVFVLWKLLLCQQFVLLHNGVLHNHHATHQEFCAQSSKRIPTIPYLSKNVIKIPKSPLTAHNTLCV
jgi:hypothetical protein